MIYLTLGDPYSVNIEILFKLREQIEAMQLDLCIIGSKWQWEYQSELLGYKPWSFVQYNEDSTRGLSFLDLSDSNFHKPPEQLTHKQRGELAYGCLKTFASLPKPDFYSVVTAPIDKFCCSLAGFSYGGQTEFFEKLAAKKAIMVLAGPKLRVGLATNHLALKQVAEHLDKSLILKKLISLDKTLKDCFDIENPKIAVTGLNPHCGDKGLFGDEEVKIIEPAIEEAIQLGLNVEGPVPADTAFFWAYEGNYDAVLAMYHDQGLGPLKSLHFYDAVNISGDLGFLRVSPDHGPANSLYGKNEARTESFFHAISLAASYRFREDTRC